MNKEQVKTELTNLYKKFSPGKADNTISKRSVKLKALYESIHNLTSFLPQNKKIGERIFCIFNDIDSLDKIPKCEVCKINLCVFQITERKYSNNCSFKCSQKNIETKLKKTNTRNNRKEKFKNELKTFSIYPSIKLSIFEIKEKLFKIFLETSIRSVSTKVYGDKNLTINIFNNTQFLNHQYNLMARIFCILNDINEVPKCPICVKNLKFKHFSSGYAKHCSHKCSFNDKNTQNKCKETMLNKYGVEHNWQIRDENGERSTELTHLKRYGVRSNLQMSETRKRTIETCNSEEANEKRNKTNLERYGAENPYASKQIQEKIKKTNLERYGFEIASNSEIVKNKIKNTNLERYGETSFMKTEEGKEKSKQTCLKHYGVTSPMHVPEILNKVKNTNIKKYGNACPLASFETRKKTRNTCLIKYGVEHPSQSSEIFEKQQKAMHKRKEYQLPSGKIIYVQGYEPYFLNNYFKNGGNEENLKHKPNEIPKITYFSSEDNKQHRYFPDFYLIKENKIIEIKSTYIFEKRKELNLIKADACRKLGLNFEFIIFDPRGNNITEVYFKNQRL